MAMSSVPAPAQIARLTALAGTGAAEWANPAVQPPFRISMGWHREFDIPELTSGVLHAAAEPGSLQLRHLAFSGYRELEFSFDLRTTIRGTGFGLRAGRTHSWIEGFRPETAGVLAFGLTIPLGDSLRGGLIVSNDALTVGARLAVGRWRVLADLASTHGESSLRFAWRRQLTAMVEVLGGASSNPSRIALGSAVTAGSWTLLVSGDRHAELGWTRTIAVSHR